MTFIISNEERVSKEMCNIQYTNCKHFINWIPYNITTAICNVLSSNKERKTCATSLSNTTAIHEPLPRLSGLFQNLFTNRSHLHKYISEGMEEFEFAEAYDKLHSLICEYQKCQKIFIV